MTLQTPGERRSRTHVKPVVVCVLSASLGACTPPAMTCTVSGLEETEATLELMLTRGAGQLDSFRYYMWRPVGMSLHECSVDAQRRRTTRQEESLGGLRAFDLERHWGGNARRRRPGRLHRRAPAHLRLPLERRTPVLSGRLPLRNLPAAEGGRVPLGGDDLPRPGDRLAQLGRSGEQLEARDPPYASQAFQFQRCTRPKSQAQGASGPV
jgi:hypothetical protein